MRIEEQWLAPQCGPERMRLLHAVDDGGRVLHARTLRVTESVEVVYRTSTVLTHAPVGLPGPGMELF